MFVKSNITKTNLIFSWGEWGGGGAVPSKRKRKRFTVKAPPAPKRYTQHFPHNEAPPNITIVKIYDESHYISSRRDENNKILIINTEKDEKIRGHQVSNVPFPFTSVSDYEVGFWASNWYLQSSRRRV